MEPDLNNITQRNALLQRLDLSKMKGKSLLTLNDISDGELIGLLDMADALKQRKLSGIRGDWLGRKSIAAIFEKKSTRTRCATAVAMADEGGRAECLSAGDIHLGQKESVADSARVIGRMFDGILFRGYAQETLELLAKHSGVPVWNGLTDMEHPTQTIGDLMTIRERFGRLKGGKVVYAGDGRNNVANSLMLGCAKAGMHFVNCTPPELSPDAGRLESAEKIAARNGGSVSVSRDPASAVAGANVIYTDVWVSMGEESKLSERIRLLSPYQVNMEMMRRTGNIESEKVIFLHCLPAFHDNRTEFAENLGSLEVTDEVFEASFSKVFDQAENRVHSLKAIFVATL